MKTYYENIEDLKPDARWLLVDLPVYGYNNFFKRNVKVETFIEVAKEIASKIGSIPLIEYFIFSAYFLAARRDCKNFIPLDEMFKAFPSAVTKIANRYILEKNAVDSCAIPNRIGAIINRDLAELKRGNYINEAEMAKIHAIIDDLGLKDMARQRPKAAHAVVYVASMLIGFRISKEAFANIVKISTPTIRHNFKNIVANLAMNKKIEVDHDSTYFTYKITSNDEKIEVKQV